MAGGDVEGFAAVAFPIVRRVFGGLIANDLVSVQPMSLPSGLIFFLDFQYTGKSQRNDWRGGDSVYGGGVVGQQVTGGVDLSQEAIGDLGSLSDVGSNAEKGFYNLNTGYTSPTGSITTQMLVAAELVVASGGFPGATTGLATQVAIGDLSEAQKKLVRFDPDLLGADTTDVVFQAHLNLTDAQVADMNFENLIAFNLIPNGSGSLAAGGAFGLVATRPSRPVRRLTRRVGRNTLEFTFHGDATALAADVANVAPILQYLEKDAFDGVPAAGTAGAIGAVAGTNTWGLENQTAIPEIDIKVDSVSVTAITKKLKAKWTPELGQDLNAYHNLDAEVELTSILSEQIALEIDREILNDLVQRATAATYYWSRSPGLFVKRSTGVELGATAAAPDFTGTVSEWYETLAETINDVSAQIHRKTLRGGANFIVTSPEVANILEFTSGFRASITHDDDRGTVGTVKVGAMSKKWDVYVDPYFPRNLCLVGRKGGSFLESGYVYAPYVPLQVTPTIFGIDDFVPRKGVMTRYAKKMVRPDMYGLVVVRGLLGESGAS
ncbi:hypothetical protein CMI37_11050 [Candidatus Pacearchaeota archaeon]|nr:hypothetical protein [Candidatus Pacearchaeota archaeon]